MLEIFNFINQFHQLISLGLSNGFEICIYEVQNRLVTNKLQLNNEKTKCLLFDVRNEMKNNDIKYLNIGYYMVTFINKANKNFGVVVENKLSMESRVSHLSKLVYLELRRKAS